MLCKRPKKQQVGKQVLILIVIALTSLVIAVQASPAAVAQTEVESKQQEKPAAAAAESTAKQAIEAVEARKLEAGKPASAGSEESKSAEEVKRKARSELAADKASDSPKEKAAAGVTAAAVAATTTATPQTTASGSQQADKSAKIEPKTAAKAASSAKQQLSGKSGHKSKLPANLGTVTSTGSGGASHYMSKHDAYSAIAEKHGALAQDAMRKSDKRRIQGFGGIQKASGGLGDVFSPFKGVTDGGLARTLGASMRSIMKSKFSVPAYVASALLGAVALMAFYESPISPLPVPPLPEPPVGRFPPEMPNIAPGTQVPFRTNQQQQYGGQNYNQRSFSRQQVLFPESVGLQAAQQRQMTVAGPIQQVAANILNSVGGKQQVAQRKSGLDYELPAPFGGASSRSFFSNNLGNNHQAAPVAPAHAKLSQGSQAQAAAKSASGFLSYFGLGGSGSASPAEQPAQAQASPVMSSVPMPMQASSAASIVSSLVEPKGQSGSQMSGSHLVNKVKSYLSRSSSVANSPSQASASSSPSSYEQYRGMSLVQALMKDTAFLTSYLSPTRKTSPAVSATAQIQPSSSAGANKQQVSNVQPNPIARMQVDNQQQPLPAAAKQAASRPAGSGYSLSRIAHAILETLSSSAVGQRAAAPSAGGSVSAAGSQHVESRKSSGDEQQQQSLSSLASATSLLSDIVSSYGAAEQQQVEKSQTSQHQQSSSLNQQNQQQHHDANQASGRSADPSQPSVAGSASSSAAIDVDQKQQHSVLQAGDKQQVDTVPASSPVSAPATTSQAGQAQLVRKTRSIGCEYPVEGRSSQALSSSSIGGNKEPSRAVQINNMVDFVSDSYLQNKMFVNFVMNRVGLSQAVPYVELLLADERH